MRGMQPNVTGSVSDKEVLKYWEAHVCAMEAWQVGRLPALYLHTNHQS